MTYDEWLTLIKKLETASHKEDIEKLKNEPLNENLNYLLVPKIKDMIITKFNRGIDRIIKSLDEIFSDENELDLALVTFKKNLNIVLSLIDNKQLNEETKALLKTSIKEGTEGAYKSLYEAAFDADEEGVYNSIIYNNRVKWSDNNEL